jgi:hypothetical protein
VFERSTLPTRKEAPAGSVSVLPAPPHGPPGATQAEIAGAALVALSATAPHTALLGLGFWGHERHGHERATGFEMRAKNSHHVADGSTGSGSEKHHTAGCIERARDHFKSTS